MSNMKTSPYRVARLFTEDELREVASLQAVSQELLLHFPNHTQWIGMALSEVKAGTRICLGAYHSVFNGDAITQELIGSVILKPNSYGSRSIELKNIFVSESHRNKGAGKRLLQETHKTCGRLGYTRITTEVPSSGQSTAPDLRSALIFFHSQRYRVSEIRASPYRTGDDLYTMDTHIVPYFRDDPFDLEALARWYVTHCCDFVIDGKLHVESAVLPSFVFSLTQTEGKLIHTRCCATIADTKAGMIRTPPGDYVVHLAFCMKPGDVEVQDRPGTRALVVSAEEIFAAHREHVIYPPPSFRRSDIGGAILNVKQEYFERLEERAESCFVVGGPFGKYLNEGHMLWMNGQSALSPSVNLQGIAPIIESLALSPSLAWKRFSADMVIDASSFLQITAHQPTIAILRIGRIARVAKQASSAVAAILRGDSPIGNRYVTREEHAALMEAVAVTPAPPNPSLSRAQPAAVVHSSNSPRQPERVACLVFTPMPLENKPLSELLGRPDEERTIPGTTQLNGFSFKKWSGIELGISRLTLVSVIPADYGTHNAGAVTRRALEMWRPDVSAVIGIGGGLAGVKLGDVVVGRNVWQWDARRLDASQRIALAPVPIAFSNWGPGNAQLFLSDPERFSAWERECIAGVPAGAANSEVAPRVFVLDVASGDAVVDSESTKFALETSNRKYGAIEMESFGVLSAIQDMLGANHPTYVIRGTSDLAANKGATDNGDGKWRERAASNAARLLLHFLGAYGTGDR